MLNEAHYKSVLKYFYFLLLDEPTILTSSVLAVRNIRRDQKKTESKKSLEIILPKMLHQTLERARKKSKDRRTTSPHLDWPTSSKDSMVVWKDFLKNDQQQYGEVLVLRFVLGLKPIEVAEALDVPVGTVFFRLNKGLELLASVFKPGET